jgi:hypothetical protein
VPLVIKNLAFYVMAHPIFLLARVLHTDHGKMILSPQLRKISMLPGISKITANLEINLNLTRAKCTSKII